ncbi:MAG: superoxide dismutase family protein [Chloroflexi bacterium]|nr:superoxide dismutase family protein [Chloroflexota bacterium]
MARGLLLAALALVPVVILVVVVLVLVVIRPGGAHEPTPGLTAEAALASPDGEAIGAVRFLQTSGGVLVIADIQGLTPGGHAFIIHEVGACSPNFDAAGDHFNPTGAEHGFVHSAWQRGGATEAHGGDLPNIYAAADGSARADFFTVGVTLDMGPAHSIFDADGSAIVVHERPDSYGQSEPDTGARLACGVINRT